MGLTDDEMPVDEWRATVDARLARIEEQMAPVLARLEEAVALLPALEAWSRT